MKPRILPIIGLQIIRKMRAVSSMKLRPIVFFVLCLISLWPLSVAASNLQGNKAKIEAGYRLWLEQEIWPQAQQAGVSKAVFDAAMKNTNLNWKLPDLVLPDAQPKTSQKQTQAEFGVPARYFNRNSLDYQTRGGRERLKKYEKILASITKTYGVPAPIIVAIWGRESGFGTAKIPHRALDVLATKAYLSTRKDMFREELIAALQILQQGHVSQNMLKSSWAGALGQPQFMPTSFLKYAVDFDRDGRLDIWDSVPDSLASIAHYLQQNGWQKTRDWGFEVQVPEHISCALEGPDQGKPIAEWAKLGIRRVNGKAFPENELKGEGFLLMPAGRFGPAFIVTPNFYVLKTYNMSDLYALFVGHSGDRMAYGMGDFVKAWDKTDDMYRSDITAMQKNMQKMGYDVGTADGLAGFKTRRSIGLWQMKNQLKPTCFPDQKLINSIIQ